jgi:predicted dehydrogenase
LIAATAGLELAVVVSSDRAKVHADLTAVTVVGDIAAVLCDDSIDLVVIATPDHLHVEQAFAALDAGKHVVIDKPFAPTLAGAREIAARAAAGDRVVAVFQNRRWDADFLTLQRLIAERALGEIVTFESHFDRFRPQVTDRWKDQRSAGVWQDLGPHLVDQALQLFGRPDGVSADLATLKQGGLAPDYAHVVMRYPEMRVILHMTQLAAAHGLRFAVHGTAASFVKHGLDPQEEQSAVGIRPDDPHWGIDPEAGVLTRPGASGALEATRIDNERGNYPAFYAAMRDAMAGQGPAPVPPAQALAVMEVIEAGIVSAAERREVRLASAAGQA